MSQPQQSSINIVLPSADQGKACPFLPPIPIPKQVVGAGMDLIVQPCMKQACAIYESCQGEASQPAQVSRARDRRLTLAKCFRELSEAPGLPGFAISFIHSLASRLEAESVPASVPTGTA